MINNNTNYYVFGNSQFQRKNGSNVQKIAFKGTPEAIKEIQHPVSEAVKFGKDLLTKCLQARSFSLETLRDCLKGQNIDVFTIQELNQAKILPKEILQHFIDKADKGISFAVCFATYKMNNNRQMEKFPIICINSPKNNSIDNLTSFISMATHEMTHALQFLNRNSQKNPYLVGENIKQNTCKMWNHFEEVLTGKVIKYFDNTKKRIPNVSSIDEILDAVFFNNMHTNGQQEFNRAARKTLKEEAELFDKRLKKAKNMLFVLEEFIKASKKEKEAYNAGYMIEKAFLGGDDNTNALRSIFYKKLIHYLEARRDAIAAQRV